ncbi:MAG: sodium/hydrogen exchanger [Candidatus Saganbacteria bacterium]|uniref:Sodium/hydrogen exchanger n=1 Tax=Candidatus Saganbacteria bacterium TaxID=2575572 RepID=A0A833KZM0_UNCSA|nr:MAG: sodium/hydrogen exchanger [Candidatus Saganbacteria bacterium]
MQADIMPLVAGSLILLSSIISLELGLSVAIIEIIMGTIAGNLGMKPEAWMLYLASFGGIILTFLAGAEIDIQMMKEKFKESFKLIS